VGCVTILATGKIFALFISFLQVTPAITRTDVAATPFTQCFAVRIIFGAIMLPPQS
jgi:hypothetical protein